MNESPASQNNIQFRADNHTDKTPHRCPIHLFNPISWSCIQQLNGHRRIPIIALSAAPLHTFSISTLPDLLTEDLEETALSDA